MYTGGLEGGKGRRSVIIISKEELWLFERKKTGAGEESGKLAGVCKTGRSQCCCPSGKQPGAS